jgi:hypothetical protein
MQFVCVLVLMCSMGCATLKSEECREKQTAMVETSPGSFCSYVVYAPQGGSCLIKYAHASAGGTSDYVYSLPVGSSKEICSRELTCACVAEANQ